jgi:hypothetical protein
MGVGRIVAAVRAALGGKARLVVRAGQVPDPRFHRAVVVQDDHGKYSTIQVRNLLVDATRPVTNCVVRLDDLRQDGRTCAGFVPTALRWAGQDGPRSALKSFERTESVLLLTRPTLGTEWELQAPVRDGTAGRCRYPLGTYEIELSVRAAGARTTSRLAATLMVLLDDARIVWRRRR